MNATKMRSHNEKKTDEKAKAFKRLVLYLKKNAKALHARGDKDFAEGKDLIGNRDFHREGRVLDKLVELAEAARSCDDGMWESIMENVQLEKL